MSVCDCYGRPAIMDEDCCGICEECLSPWQGQGSGRLEANKTLPPSRGAADAWGV
jgi:hypothetical protein